MREGFLEEEVELLPDSALQDKTVIIDILRDTHKVSLHSSSLPRTYL
jgi:hypothetical protein